MHFLLGTEGVPSKALLLCGLSILVEPLKSNTLEPIYLHLYISSSCLSSSYYKLYKVSICTEAIVFYCSYSD